MKVVRLMQNKNDSLAPRDLDHSTESTQSDEEGDVLR